MVILATLQLLFTISFAVWRYRLLSYNEVRMRKENANALPVTLRMNGVQKNQHAKPITVERMLNDQDESGRVDLEKQFDTGEQYRTDKLALKLQPSLRSNRQTFHPIDWHTRGTGGSSIIGGPALYPHHSKQSTRFTFKPLF